MIIYIQFWHVQLFILQIWEIFQSDQNDVNISVSIHNTAR